MHIYLHADSHVAALSLKVMSLGSSVFRGIFGWDLHDGISLLIRRGDC